LNIASEESVMTMIKAGRVLSQVRDFWTDGRARLGRRERRGPEASVGGGMKFGRAVSLWECVCVEDCRRDCCRRQDTGRRKSFEVGLDGVGSARRCSGRKIITGCIDSCAPNVCNIKKRSRNLWDAPTDYMRRKGLIGQGFRRCPQVTLTRFYPT
jgi:hypothetical protein